jgi:hypothetical protein
MPENDYALFDYVKSGKADDSDHPYFAAPD